MPLMGANTQNMVDSVLQRVRADQGPIYEAAAKVEGFTERMDEVEEIAGTVDARVDRVDPGTTGDIGQAIVQTPAGPQWAPPQARISAHALGVRANVNADQTAALHAAFTAAESLGGGRTIELPPGRIRIDGTFSLAGYSSGMVGTLGSTIVGGYGDGNGTVLYAVNQTGPVLDFNGYLAPRGQKGRMLFADFNVEGDGTVGADKMGISLYTGDYASSIDMQRITISNTGGIGLYVKDFYLSDFYGVTVLSPVDSFAQNTPYVRLEGANGNRYFGLGLRSTNHNAAIADTPVNGALRLVQGSVFQHHQSVFYGLWFENNHLGTNAALIVSQTNNVVFSDTQFFDVYRVAGATGTAHARIQTPAMYSYGGNVWRGLVPGKGTAPTEVELGLDISQSGTYVSGPKGHGGDNVRLASGTSYCHIELTGASLPGNNLGITDNSGNTTNTKIDGPMGIWELGGRAGTEVLKVAGLTQTNKVRDFGSISGNVTLDLNFGANIFRMVLTGTTTVQSVAYTAGLAGREMTLIVQQDGTGSRSLLWNTSAIRFAGGTPPTASTGANRVDVFTFVYDGTNWRETSRAMNTN